MPKFTFEKLSQEKQQAFLEAFMQEFATKSYEQASLSIVVRELGIAKGSVYQYFEGKLDLYLYLKQLAENKKISYVLGLRRQDYPDFWAYYRAQYEQGILFDLECPLESRLLYQISQMDQSSSLAYLLEDWKKRGLLLSEAAVQQEVDQGHFRQDVPARTMAQFIISVSDGILDLLQNSYSIDLKQNIASGKPVFAGDKAVLMEAVDQQIKLLRAALKAP